MQDENIFEFPAIFPNFTYCPLGDSLNISELELRLRTVGVFAARSAGSVAVFVRGLALTLLAELADFAFHLSENYLRKIRSDSPRNGAFTRGFSASGATVRARPTKTSNSHCRQHTHRS
jgi:hypothetical protein